MLCVLNATDRVCACEGSQKAVMSVEKVLEVMLDEATGVDDDSNLLWDADFAEGFMKGTSTATPFLHLCFQLSGSWHFGDTG